MANRTAWQAAILTAVLALPPTTSPEAALVAAWAFDEAGGTNASPSAGAVSGTLNGGAAFAPGQGIQGGALNVPGGTSGGFVDFGTSLFPVGPFSVQAWVKTTDTAGMIPVSVHTATVVAGFILALNDIGDGCGGPAGSASFYVAYPCSGGSAAVVNDGQWHQLVGTYDGTRTRIYVDGVFQSQSAGGNPLNSPPAGTPLVAGGLRSAGGTLINGYSGLLDNMALWDTTLTADEIRDIYASTIPAAVPEPMTLTLLAGALAGLGLVRRRKV